jgi:exonuclease III
MATFVTWNTGGLRKHSPNSERKGIFLKRKIMEELRGATIIALQETHLRDDQDINQEVLDLNTIYNFYHSFSHEGDKFSGVSLLVTEDYEVRSYHEMIQGRILVVKATKKASNKGCNIVVVYGFHSGFDMEDRQNFIEVLRG